MASKKEFIKYVAERQAKQQAEKDREVFAYFKQSYIRKRGNWGINFGGYKR